MLRLTGNYTYTSTKQHGGPNDGWPLNDTPRHQLNTKLAWQNSDRLDTWVRGEYRSDRYRRTTPTPNDIYKAFGDYKAYTIFHLGANYQLDENISLSAAIYNLFDKDFMSYKEYKTGLYANEYSNNQERRRLWMSATYQF